MGRNVGMTPDALCDRIVAELPALGDECAKELDAIEEHLTRFHAASQRYNAFVRDSLRSLELEGRECARVMLSRWNNPGRERQIRESAERLAERANAADAKGLRNASLQELEAVARSPSVADGPSEIGTAMAAVPFCLRRLLRSLPW